VTVIRWEDPPPDNLRRRPHAPRRTEHWKLAAAELRANPGGWAVIAESVAWSYAGGIAGQIKAGRLAAFRPAGAFEAQTRTVAQSYIVYARYVGGES
jgi:hypothetical protein